MIAAQIVSTNIKKELGSYFSTEAHGDNDIIRYINSAMNAIVISRNFWFNQFKYDLVVVDWITKYDIPFQIETFFILDSSWEEVDYEDFSDYFRLKDKTWVIWIWEDIVECTTPGTYSIFYRWYPTQITSLTDSLELPAHFYDLVVLKATYFWFMDIQAYTKASEKNKIYEWMISDLAKRSSDPKPKKTKRLNKSSSNSKVW